MFKRIVSQSASVSYSHFPVAQLLLPAPRIAGLLPARVASSIPQITVFKAPPRESSLDRQRAIWAAQDAELVAFLNGARQRILAAFTERDHRACARSVRSVTMEVYCAP